MLAPHINIKMPTILKSRAAAARRIAGAFRKFRARKMMAAYARKGRYIRRAVGLGNPTPTFVETYSSSPISVNAGGVFSVRISDIPQVQQYANLYKQYRINWVKVMLVPDFNSQSADHNAAQYNASLPVPNYGLARIAYAVNDSPQLVVPATEAVLLEDNGCKVKSLGPKWSASFKPVPDVGVTAGTNNNTVWTRQKYRQWFNFVTDIAHLTDNPLHYGLSYYITQLVANTTIAPTYNVYFKVSFSLRDPQ